MVRNPLHIKDNIPKLPMFTGPPYGITDNYDTMTSPSLDENPIFCDGFLHYLEVSITWHFYCTFARTFSCYVSVMRGEDQDSGIGRRVRVPGY